MDTKKTISFSVTFENLKYLDERCDELGMTRSSYINMIISQHKQQDNLVAILPQLINVLSDLDKKVSEKEKEKEV